MFHIMLLFLPIIFIAIFISILCVGLFLIIAGIIGGVSTALIVKNKLFRNLIVISFCIGLFFGLLFLMTLISIIVILPSIFYIIATAIIFLCIVIFCIAGIKLSSSIKNKVGKIILMVIFCSILVFIILLGGLGVVALF